MLVLAVAPAHRGRGIAKALVSACITCARHDSARVIGLFTSELMISAQQLYASLGFRRERELPPRLGLRYWRYKLDLSALSPPPARAQEVGPADLFGLSDLFGFSKQSRMN